MKTFRTPFAASRLNDLSKTSKETSSTGISPFFEETIYLGTIFYPTGADYISKDPFPSVQANEKYPQK